MIRPADGTRRRTCSGRPVVYVCPTVAMMSFVPLLNLILERRVRREKGERSPCSAPLRKGCRILSGTQSKEKEEEVKALRGSGKPTLPAPSLKKDVKGKAKGKNKDNELGRGKDGELFRWVIWYEC